jgi:hypothetical protein
LLLGAVFPEMTEPAVPFLQRVPAAPPDAAILASIDNLSGQYQALSASLPDVTAASLGFRLEADR